MSWRYTRLTKGLFQIRRADFYCSYRFFIEAILGADLVNSKSDYINAVKAHRQLLSPFLSATVNQHFLQQLHAATHKDHPADAARPQRLRRVPQASRMVQHGASGLPALRQTPNGLGHHPEETPLVTLPECGRSP